MDVDFKYLIRWTDRCFIYAASLIPSRIIVPIAVFGSRWPALCRFCSIKYSQKNAISVLNYFFGTKIQCHNILVFTYFPLFFTFLPFSTIKLFSVKSIQQNLPHVCFKYKLVK